MDCLNQKEDVYEAWSDYWYTKDITIGVEGMPGYQNTIEGVPHICMKVPTGGGKHLWPVLESNVFLIPCQLKNTK